MKTENNTLLITGGGTGIGLSLASEFLRLGNTVIICGRREEKLMEAKKQYPALHTIVCDLTSKEDREKLAARLLSEFSSLNVLINNAGIQLETDLGDASLFGNMQDEINTNLLAPLHLSALLIPHLKTKTSAAIVHVTSGLAFTPIARMPVYCATKAALHSISLSLRHQLRDTSVRVFELAPPMVDTELDRGAREKRGITHRGITVQECLTLAMAALRDDVYEAPLGGSLNMKTKPEEMFGILNR
jgi:uncharacterized oxidoreductase